MSESEALSKAPAFNPEKDYAEVHAHVNFAFKQGGFYYDFHGNPVSVQPDKPIMRKGVRKLREGKHIKADLQLPGVTVVGKVPQAIEGTQKENARAKAAEDLLG